MHLAHWPPPRAQRAHEVISNLNTPILILGAKSESIHLCLDTTVKIILYIAYYIYVYYIGSMYSIRVVLGSVLPRLEGTIVRR